MSTNRVVEVAIQTSRKTETEEIIYDYSAVYKAMKRFIKGRQTTVLTLKGEDSLQITIHKFPNGEILISSTYKK